MKILYLYAEVMGYTMATIKALVERGAEVHVVHWDHKKLTPYQAPPLPNVHMYNRSEMSVKDMQRLASSLVPTITYISGWQDKGYLIVTKGLREKGGVVVVGFDGQWFGTARQRLAPVLGVMGYFGRYFSHAWVSGIYQFEYARRLGFDKRCIVYDLLSADLTLFHTAFRKNLSQKTKFYPHRFLFVGRFEPIKGLDTLVQAWNILSDNKRDWELHLIGSGSLKTVLQSTPGVVVKDFMQPDQLMEEVALAGCFVLPSRDEPWGVVLHEFAAAGLPLIVSDVVGAASSFLIPGMNGYGFRANDAQDLVNQMVRIIEMTDPVLLSMAEYSYNLSHRITPESSAGNLLSITDQNKSL